MFPYVAQFQCLLLKKKKVWGFGAVRHQNHKSSVNSPE